MTRRLDVAVVGGGLVGLATAVALLERDALSLTLFETEDRLAVHQSGRNSGVVHSGLYYRPGSLRAKLCVEGRVALERFCAAEGVAFERCGKLVIASSPAELPRLAELEARGRANGLAGLRRLDPSAIRDHEPQAAGLAALLVPEAGIADYVGVCAALARRVRQRGGEVATGIRVLSGRRAARETVLETTRGAVHARLLVACAGLHADRLARACGLEPEVRIAPFRGEYFRLAPARRGLVRHLIYPVPDPRLPFLGVHLTRRLDGEIIAGPNAVLALAREGYARSDVSLRDLAELAAWPGFWRMAFRHWRAGLAEARRSSSRRAFAAELRRLVPSLGPDDLIPGGAGVRAMALGRDGTLLDDFHLVEAEGMLHVLNAPSPAATAALAIGRWIAERARAGLSA